MHLALTVPTVLDRVIQQAVAQVIGSLYEPHFNACSYGFRPGRSARMALTEMEEAHRDGLRFAVDCDLKSFFDTVDHGLLMSRLARRIKDPRVLRLISRYLRAGVVLPDGNRERTTCGVPQGGPLTPPTMLQTIRFGAFSRGIRAHLVDYFDFFLVNPNLFNNSSYYLSACHPVSFSQSICYFF